MEKYNKEIKRFGEVNLEFLYQRRDMEEAVWSSYYCEGILRDLFKAFILVEGYNKSKKSYLELL